MGEKGYFINLTIVLYTTLLAFRVQEATLFLKATLLEVLD